MSRVLAIIGVLILGTVLCPAQGGQRLWRDTAGKTISAKFLWANDELLYLKLPTGKEIEIELGRLSNDDLEFVREFRNKQKAKGIVYEAPIAWETFRSRNLTSTEADRIGFYPLNNHRDSNGKLEIEFRRFGPAPKLAPNQTVVLRMTSAGQEDAGTVGPIKVEFRGKTVGSGTNVPSSATFDITLSPVVLSGKGSVALAVTCGNDTVKLRTRKSGAGPRLLVVERKPD